MNELALKYKEILSSCLTKKDSYTIIEDLKDYASFEIIIDGITYLIVIESDEGMEDLIIADIVKISDCKLSEKTLDTISYSLYVDEGLKETIEFIKREKPYSHIKKTYMQIKKLKEIEFSMELVCDVFGLFE